MSPKPSAFLDLLYSVAVRFWAPLLIGCVFGASLLGAQTGHSRPLFPPSYPYLLRIEKREAYMNTCVLLKKDGSFHFERIRNVDRVTVLEGELSPDALANIATLLQRPDLVNLRQDDIPEPLIPFGDEIQLNVFRHDHWQDLVFPDSKDRKKLVPTVDSLVDWLAGLPKLQHREMGEFEGRNNCLTEGKIELRSRPVPPPVVLPPDLHTTVPRSLEPGLGKPTEAVAPPPFLLKMTVDRMGEPMQRRCVVIYPDGRYHAEKSSQAYGEGMRSQVVESMLTPPELQNLSQILDAPELRVEYREQTPSGGIIRGGEFVRLQIPTPEGTLRSLFANLEFVPGYGSGKIESDDLAAIPGSHLALLAPLRAWFKREVEDSKIPPSTDALPNSCKPRL